MSDLLKFPESTAIGLHAMIYLTLHKDRLVSQGEIAAFFKISEAHLSKVLQQLRKSQYVESVRGPAGGFSLNCDPEKVSLLDIHEALQGPQTSRACLLQQTACIDEECPIGKSIKKIDEELLGFLRSMSLKTVTKALSKKRLSISGKGE